MVERLNKSCRYFPCHKGLESCVFCYCPFYPCGNTDLGSYIHSRKNKKNIWSCKDCTWIHKKKTVDRIFCAIKKSDCLPSSVKHRQKPKIVKQVKETAVIIIAHGSKAKRANDTVTCAAETVGKETGLMTMPAYLQFHRPKLCTSVKKAVKNGCEKIIIVPFFLFNGNHVIRDIPKAINKEVEKHKEIEFVYAGNLGQDSRINQIVLSCVEEMLDNGKNSEPPKDRIKKL